jgi:DNA (cytosine-5)-methyltransferase 3A
MNVLSLFDGMSCGRIALERLGIQVDNYYASEIDKYAIQVSQANYPDIIQVGDVTELDTSTLPKIDLIMGGSPCQGFSFAGKQLAFDDPRSALFFEFVRCVEELKPKYFLLENVRMKKEYLDVISEYMGVEPIMINSALVSAQNRVRFYWTNIPGIEQPEQRGIVLRDILETNASNEYLSKMTTKDDKSFCLTANYGFAGAKNSLEKKQRTMIPTDVDPKYYLSEKAIEYMKKSHVNEWTKGKTREEIYIKNESQKSNTLTANMYKGVPYNVIAVDSYREVRTEEAKQLRKEMRQKTGKDHTPFRAKKLVPREDGKVGTLTTNKQYISKQSVEKYVEDVNAEFNDPYNKKTVKGDKSTTLRTNSSNGNMWVNDKAIKETKPKQVGVAVDINEHDILKRVYSEDEQDVYWRKLTPVECERLQTVPDNYTNHVSNTQRFKMLGNGWTIEVIAHILKNIKL